MEVVGYQQPLHVLLFRQAYRDAVVAQGLLFLPQAALIQRGLLLHTKHQDKFPGRGGSSLDLVQI